MPFLSLAVAAALAAEPCPPALLVQSLLDLFPPAAAERRLASARTLAACRDPRAAGALGVAMSHDPTPEVRVEAARAWAP